MILICKRASGELKTTATWIREFVQRHPDYRQDSVVSESIAHDLVMEMRAIGEVRELEQCWRRAPTKHERGGMGVAHARLALTVTAVAF